MEIAFFGSSIVSAYWNGAATYYRGIVKGLAQLGHKITFYEPDAYDRQKHRDLSDPKWVTVSVFDANEAGRRQALKAAKRSDVIVKASGLGIFDQELETAIAEDFSGKTRIYWDVDAPATLDRVLSNPDDYFKKLIPKYDLILTYGGGPPVVRAFFELGARECIPIYNALDPETHFPVSPDEHYSATLTFLGNRLPDREKRVTEFFLQPAARRPTEKFLLGGNGWEIGDLSDNVKYMGHVYTKDHNVMNSSCLAVLNVNRESMAKFGYSPPTRIFEAAGAAACIISDAWYGIEQFLEPNKEVLIASDGREVDHHLDGLSRTDAKKIGQSALKRVKAEHTYDQRAAQVHKILTGTL